MRIGVLVGYDETGKSEVLACGIPGEVKDLAKKLTVENPTQWRKLRFFDQPTKKFNAAEPKVEEKKTRGRPKKEDSEEL